MNVAFLRLGRARCVAASFTVLICAMFSTGGPPTLAADAAAAEPLRVCLVSGSLEYKSNESLAEFQKFLEANYPVNCSRAFIVGKDEEHLPGLENLDDCDVMLLFTRRLKLSGDELARIKNYCLSGRPIVGVRTASHAIQTWLDLDKEVLGGNYKGHYGNDAETDIDDRSTPPRTIPCWRVCTPFRSAGSLYKNQGVAATSTSADDRHDSRAYRADHLDARLQGRTRSSTPRWVTRRISPSPASAACWSTRCSGPPADHVPHGNDDPTASRNKPRQGNEHALPFEVSVSCCWPLRLLTALRSAPFRAPTASDKRPRGHVADRRRQRRTSQIEIELTKDIVYGRARRRGLEARPGPAQGPDASGAGNRVDSRRRLARRQQGRVRALIRDSARAGYVAVSIDYRLVPKYVFPAQVEDCQVRGPLAACQCREAAGRPSADRRRRLVGRRHLAMMLGAMDTGDGLEGEGGSADASSRVQVVVSYAGPTDLQSRFPSASKNLVADFVGGPAD